MFFDKRIKLESKTKSLLWSGLLLFFVISACSNPNLTPKKVTRYVAGKTSSSNFTATIQVPDALKLRAVNQITFDRVTNYQNGTKPTVPFDYRITIWNESGENSSYFDPYFSRDYKPDELEPFEDNLTWFIGANLPNKATSPILIKNDTYKMVIQAVTDKGVLSLVDDKDIITITPTSFTPKIWEVRGHDNILNTVTRGDFMFVYGHRLSSDDEFVLDNVPIESDEISETRYDDEYSNFRQKVIRFKVPNKVSYGSGKTLKRNELTYDNITILEGNTSIGLPIDTIAIEGAYLCDPKTLHYTSQTSKDKPKINTSPKCMVWGHSNGRKVITIEGVGINKAKLSFVNPNDPSEVKPTNLFDNNISRSSQNFTTSITKGDLTSRTHSGRLKITYSSDFGNKEVLTDYYLYPGIPMDITANKIGQDIVGDSIKVKFYPQTSFQTAEGKLDIQSIVLRDRLYGKQIEYTSNAGENQFKIENDSLIVLTKMLGRQDIAEVRTVGGNNRGFTNFPVAIHLGQYTYSRETYDTKPYFTADPAMTIENTTEDMVYKGEMFVVEGKNFMSQTDTASIWIGDYLVLKDEIHSVSRDKIEFRFPGLNYNGYLKMTRKIGERTIVAYSPKRIRTVKQFRFSHQLFWTDHKTSPKKATTSAKNLEKYGATKIITLKSLSNNQSYEHQKYSLELAMSIKKASTGEVLIYKQKLKTSDPTNPEQQISLTGEQLAEKLGYFMDTELTLIDPEIVFYGRAFDRTKVRLFEDSVAFQLDNNTTNFKILNFYPKMAKAGDLVTVEVEGVDLTTHDNEIIIDGKTATIDSTEQNLLIFEMPEGKYNFFGGTIKLKHLATTPMEVESGQFWQYDLGLDFGEKKIINSEGEERLHMLGGLTTLDEIPSGVKGFDLRTAIASNDELDLNSGTTRFMARRLDAETNQEVDTIFADFDLGISSTSKSITLSEMVNLKTVSPSFLSRWKYTFPQADKSTCLELPEELEMRNLFNPGSPYELIVEWTHPTDNSIKFSYTKEIIALERENTLPLSPDDSDVKQRHKLALKYIACGLDEIENLNWLEEKNIAAWEKTQINNDLVQGIFVGPGSGVKLVGKLSPSVTRLYSDYMNFKLDFRGNIALEIPISSEYSKLTNIEQFYIYDTKATGELPKEICENRAQYGDFRLQDETKHTPTDLSKVVDCDSKGKNTGNFLNFQERQRLRRFSNYMGHTNSSYDAPYFNVDESQSTNGITINEEGYITKMKFQEENLFMRGSVAHKDSLTKVDFMHKFPALDTLRLNHPMISQIFPNIEKMKSLKALFLQDSGFDTIPKSILALETLESFAFYNNPIAKPLQLPIEFCTNRNDYQSFRLKESVTISYYKNPLDRLMQDCPTTGKITGEDKIKFSEAHSLMYALHALWSDQANQTGIEGKLPFRGVFNASGKTVIGRNDLNVEVDSKGNVTHINWDREAVNMESGHYFQVKDSIHKAFLAFKQLDSLKYLNLDGHRIYQVPIPFAFSSETKDPNDLLLGLDSISLVHDDKENKLNIFVGKLHNKVCDNREYYSDYKFISPDFNAIVDLPSDKLFLDCERKVKMHRNYDLNPKNDPIGGMQLYARDIQGLLTIGTNLKFGDQSHFPRINQFESATESDALFNLGISGGTAEEQHHYFRIDTMTGGRVSQIVLDNGNKRMEDKDQYLSPTGSKINGIPGFYFDSLIRFTLTAQPNLTMTDDKHLNLEGAKKLNYLKLTENRSLELTSFKFPDNSKLKQIHLQGTSTLNFDWNKFKPLVELVYLDMSNTNLVTMNADLNTFSNLSTLILSDNPIRGTINSSYPNSLVRLEMENIHHNQSSELFRILSSLTNLSKIAMVKLNAFVTKGTGSYTVIYDQIGDLASVNSMRVLELNDNENLEIRGKISVNQPIETDRNLYVYNISGMDVEGNKTVDPDCLKKFPKYTNEGSSGGIKYQDSIDLWDHAPHYLFTTQNVTVSPEDDTCN